MARRDAYSKKFSKALGLRIRALRESRGWTLEDTEEHGWKECSHLQRIESGKNITLRTLLNVARLLGVHPSELLKDL